MGESKNYQFDKLKMFFGEDYKVSDGIIISQPTIGNILEFGEKRFYEVLNPFVANPTSFRVSLWKVGIDWTKISDYELFYRLILQLKMTPQDTYLLFGDLDFSKFTPCKRKDDEDERNIVLYNQEQSVIIDEEVYCHISRYLRTMFNIFPKVEKAKGRTTKEWMIEEDIKNSEMAKPSESSLMPMISFCLNHPGFKYKKKELKELGIFEFNDSVQRLLVYESTSSLMKGMYSGFMDVSKIDKKEFNFMREFNS